MAIKDKTPKIQIKALFNGITFSKSKKSFIKIKGQLSKYLIFVMTYTRIRGQYMNTINGLISNKDKAPSKGGLDPPLSTSLF